MIFERYQCSDLSSNFARKSRVESSTYLIFLILFIEESALITRALFTGSEVTIFSISFGLLMKF